MHPANAIETVSARAITAIERDARRRSDPRKNMKKA